MGHGEQFDHGEPARDHRSQSNVSLTSGLSPCLCRLPSLPPGGPLRLTASGRRLESKTHHGTHLAPPTTKAAAVSEPPDTFEVSRTEKLRRIADLGLDPWGGRFDG